MRDRTHFFASYERDNVDTVRIIALPADAIRLRPAMAPFRPRPITRWRARNSTIAFSAAHSFMLRYGIDRQQSLRAQRECSSDTSQVDILNRSHSLVLEETWARHRTWPTPFASTCCITLSGRSRADNGLASDGRP